MALPLLVWTLLIVALAVPLRPAHHRTSLDDYLPDVSTVGQVVGYPSGEHWQRTQYRVEAPIGFDALPAEAATALGYAHDDAAPELHGQWLRVDLQGPTSELRTLAFHLERRQLTLQAYLSATTWLTFSPGLPVLDVDLLAGRRTTWSGTATSLYRDEGQISSKVSAVLSLSATDGEPGCVTTSADFTFTDGAHSTRTWTWCNGRRGFAGFSVGEWGFVADAEHVVPSVDLTARAPVPQFTGAVRRLVGFRRAGGVLYRADLPVVEYSAQAGESLILASSTAVWALRPDRVTPDELDREVGWRGRPGGLISAMTTTGDQVVVATTNNQILAYAANGWVRWRASTHDTVSRLIRAGDTIVAVEGHQGLRALDARTGTTQWTWRGGQVIDVSAGGARVVVAQDGTLTALDRTDGHRLWTARSPQVAAVAVLGSTVVTQQGGALVGRSATDGSPTWGHATTGRSAGLWSMGTVVIVGDSRATSAIRADGSVVWRTPGEAQAVAVTGQVVALAFGDRIEAWGPAARLGRWPTPDMSTAPLTGRMAVSDQAIVARQVDNNGTSTWRAYL